MLGAFHAIFLRHPRGNPGVPGSSPLQTRVLAAHLHNVSFLSVFAAPHAHAPNDGQSPEQNAEKLRVSSQKFLDMAYDGLSDPNLAPNLAKIVIALRTPDYSDLLPQMLKSLDDDNRANPHYAGWARHSYNDTVPSAK